MGLKLGDAVLYLLTNNDGLKKGLSSAKSEVMSWSSGMRSFMLKAGVAVGAATGAALTAAAGGLTKLAIDSARLKPISDAFMGLTTDLEGGSDRMIKALKEGSAGMSTNIELMQAFNKSAQLISVDFAATLPDAMKYISKVSASTGEDFNFLMNSYITGVGRMSPMILDNLSVQVKEADAVKRAAQMFKVQEKAVTEDQKQLAMANLVLEAMAENTAKIPDLVGTAQAGWKSFTAGLKDFKDNLGMKLLPLFKPLFEWLSRLSNEALPKVLEKLEPLLNYFGSVAEGGFYLGDALDALPKPFQRVAKIVGKFIYYLRQSHNPITALRAALSDVIPKEVQDKITMITDKIREFVDTVVNFVSEHSEEVIGAIKGIGIALGTILVLGTIGSIIAALANPLTLIIALAGLLGAAWAGNWGGIRDKLTEVWGQIQPILSELWTWLQTNIPVAIQALSTWFTGTLVPAVSNVWSWIKTNLIPVLQDIGTWLGDNIPKAIESFQEFWDNLTSAIEFRVQWFNENLLPVLEAIGNLFGSVIALAINEVNELLEVLNPQFEAVANWIAEHINPAAEDMNEILGPFVDKVLTAFNKGLEKASEWLKKVTDWINKLAEAIDGLNPAKLKLLSTGSPSPFAEGLRQANKQLPHFIRQMRQVGALSTDINIPELSDVASRYATGPNIRSQLSTMMSQIVQQASQPQLVPQTVEVVLPNVTSLTGQETERLAKRVADYLRVRK